MFAAAQDVHRTARHRGFREACGGRVARHPAGPDRFPQLPLGQARPRRRPGGAERAERRRQDKPARGDVVPVARPRSAQCPARRHRPPRRRGRAGAVGLGRRRDGRDAARRRSAIGTGRDGRRRASAASIRIDGEPVRSQSALGRTARRAVADAADGPAVCRGSGRPAALSGPARPRRSIRRTRRGSAATSRRCANARGCCATGRTDPAWLAALEEVMADRGGRGRGGAARRDRAARPRLRRGAGRLSARPGRRWSARSKHWLDEMPALAAEDRFARGAGRRPAERCGGGRRRGRAAPLRSRRHPRREGHRRRGGLDRRAEGAADRDRAGAGAAAARDPRRAAAAAARRGGGASRRGAPRRAVRDRSPGSTARPG